MNEYLKDVRREIEDLHVFFVNWFNGKAPKQALKSQFSARFHPNFVFISPGGQVLQLNQLTAGITSTYATHQNFRIKIRDVAIRHDLGNYLMATYTEWQIGSKRTPTKNGRLSSVILTKQWPMKWLQVHETWLPEDVQAAGPYDF